MAIISFDKDTVIDYIPECDREDDNPCIVQLKFVPYSRVAHYARLIAAKAKGKKNPDMGAIASVVQRQQFVESVQSVSGYAVKGEAGTEDKEVTDPSEFYDTADSDLITEIIGAMESQSKLDEGQRKNF